MQSPDIKTRGDPPTFERGSFSERREAKGGESKRKKPKVQLAGDEVRKEVQIS